MKQRHQNLNTGNAISVKEKKLELNFLQILKKIFLNIFFRKTIFDGAPIDPDYVPLPEDRPGGFNWGDQPNN